MDSFPRVILRLIPPYLRILNLETLFTRGESTSSFKRDRASSFNLTCD